MLAWFRQKCERSSLNKSAPMKCEESSSCFCPSHDLEWHRRLMRPQVASWPFYATIFNFLICLLSTNVSIRLFTSHVKWIVDEYITNAIPTKIKYTRNGFKRIYVIKFSKTKIRIVITWYQIARINVFLCISSEPIQYWCIYIFIFIIISSTACINITICYNYLIYILKYF